MYIDLNDKITRFLVQEYVNKICYYSSKKELNWNIHKLIHTFSVADMAQKLINETKPALSKELQKQILNSAILHDVGRCYEFKNGEKVHLDHGQVGAELIKKHFPEMTVEANSTLYHNKCPSDKDPKSCQTVLNYVRDADILGNIKYEIEKTDIWLSHIIGDNKEAFRHSSIDREILSAVKEQRPANLKNMNINKILTSWLWQLCWYYNLRTKAAFKIAHKEKLFFRLRDTICQKIVPLTTKNKKKQKELIQKIQKTFADELFS